jgi:hypothetical protein
MAGTYYLCFSTSAIEHRHHPLALLLAGLVGKSINNFFNFLSGSRVPDPNNKKRMKKIISCLAFFCNSIPYFTN